MPFVSARSSSAGRVSLSLVGVGVGVLVMVAAIVAGCGSGAGSGGPSGAAGSAGGASGSAGSGGAGTTGAGGMAGGGATAGSAGGTAGTIAGSAGNGSPGRGGNGGNIGATGGNIGATGGSGGATTGAAGAAGSTGSGGRGGSTGTAGAAGATTTGDFYVGPNGADSNPGTQASPFKTITAAHARVAAGGTIWLLPGTNMLTATTNISKSGTAAAHIRLQAMAGAARPVLDFSGQAVASSNRGVNVTADYWEMRGFEIRNAGDNCIAISGSNNTFDQLVIHGCSDTGLQITASSDQATDNTRAANNLVLNCDSYENLDQATNGENADGFAAKLRIGPGNVFRGCRSWNNADDGWDFFASDDVVTVDGCWAFLNGKVVSGSNSAGDGNGFKLGGMPDGSPGEGGAVHIVKNSYAFENRACGFVRNNNPDVPMLTSCGANANGTAFCQVTSSPVVTITMTGAQGKAAVRNADGSLPAIQ
jgi:hypothetical protein